MKRFIVLTLMSALIVLCASAIKDSNLDVANKIELSSEIQPSFDYVVSAIDTDFKTFQVEAVSNDFGNPELTVTNLISYRDVTVDKVRHSIAKVNISNLLNNVGKQDHRCSITTAINLNGKAKGKTVAFES